MFCTGCGRQITPEMQFCPDCGTKVAARPYQGIPNTGGQPVRPVAPVYPGYQQPVTVSPLKLIIGVCLFLGAIFYAVYYFGETMPGMFRAMKYLPAYALFALLSNLGFLVSMGLAIGHLFSRDPRHTLLKAASAVLIGAAALQSFAYICLIAEGARLKTPAMLFLMQISILGGSILMLMNLTGSLKTNLITVPVLGAASLLMLIGMLITSGNTALSVMGGLGYVFFFAALAMLFTNMEEPSLIPGRKADGLR
ncbi:MAG: zinc ribbon domain-containing protein [Clostridiales bacterium]|nr:zinc ribbon domain-containing protein [Clostridiales bacterium]